jgi:hypothetical protein
LAPNKYVDDNGFTIEHPDMEDGLIHLFNLPADSQWKNDGTYYTTFTVPLSTDNVNNDEEEDFVNDVFYTFSNVWDRDRLYVHASFVNYTPFQYLGQNGEFYPKPSKIYEFNDSSKDFEVWYTLDGFHTIDLPYEDVEIELCFILDNRKYISE